MATGTKAKQAKELLLYCGCGIASTIADSLVYFPLVNLTSVPAPVCVLLATVFSNLVSFVLMKPLVFRSKDWSKGTLVPEFVRFATTRVLTILLEVLFSFVTVSLLRQDENIMRIIGWTVIALGNYFCAKFLVFKNKRR